MMRITPAFLLLFVVQVVPSLVLVSAADSSSNHKNLLRRHASGTSPIQVDDHDKKRQRQRQLSTAITPPIDMTEMAEFAITLTPTIESTLQTVLKGYDPYRMEETITQTFKNVNVQGLCTLDIVADLTIKSITGISSLEITSMSIANGATLHATPKIHWKGDFTFDAKFTKPIVTLVDMTVKGNGCFGAVNINENLSNVAITLTDPTTMNLNTFIKGHLDTISKQVSVEEAKVNAMDLSVSGAVTVSGLSATLEKYLPDLSSTIQSLITNGIDTHVEPKAQQSINTMLDSNLPVALSV